MAAISSAGEPRNSGFFSRKLAEADPEVAKSISDELTRQQEKIELIASENIVSRAVLEAQGSVLTNKYAEGYPGRRYYGGCEYVDVTEELAIDRAKRLFSCDFANVQPHSGAQANQAAFFALLLANTQEGFFADPIYGGNRDMVGWKLVGFPGVRYDFRDVMEKPNQAYALPPVGMQGRPEWGAR